MRKLLNNIYKYIGGLRIFRRKRQSRSDEVFKMQERTTEELKTAIELTEKAIARNKQNQEFLNAMFASSKPNPQISTEKG